MDKYKFGNRLCSLREEKGLSQKELATILDVSDKAISKWENGQSIPRMETLEKIAEVFNVGLDTLLNDDEVEMERHRVKRNIFRNKYKGNRRIFVSFGLGAIGLSFIWCIIDLIIHFCFNKSNLEVALTQNISVLIFPIGFLTIYAFLNSWLLRLISGIKDFFLGGANCISVENSEHRLLNVVNGVSCIFSLLPFAIGVASFDADLSLIHYVTVYSASFVLLTINLLTSEYANISLYFTENGVFEKSIDYGDFYPYSKMEIIESNIEDIHLVKTDKLKIEFKIAEKKFKVSIPEQHIETICSYMNIDYDEKKIQKNSTKPKPIYYILVGIGAAIMFFGFVMFMSNMQFDTIEVDYTKPSKEFIPLDGMTSVVKYNDRLYAFTEQNSAVDVFDLDGNFIYANQITNHPKGMAEYYLVNDNLYIKDKLGDLYRYDLNGNFLGRCVVFYKDEDVATISKYDKNNKLISSFETEEESVTLIYFDNANTMFHSYDYLITYDGKNFNKTSIDYYEAYIGEYVKDAVFLEENGSKKFDGVEYYVFRGCLYANSDDDLIKLYSVPFFSWYRHSIFTCWFTGAFGMAFIFFSTRIYNRIEYKKRKK